MPEQYRANLSMPQHDLLAAAAAAALCIMHFSIDNDVSLLLMAALLGDGSATFVGGEKS